MKSLAAAILVVSIILMLNAGCSDNGKHYSKETLDRYAQQLTSDLKELTPTQSWSLSTDEKRGKLMLGTISYKLVIGLKQPDSLEMNRKDPLHQLVISDFSKRIDDSKQVTELYKKLLELPVFPNGPTACPADNGVQYELAFVKKRSASV